MWEIRLHAREIEGRLEKRSALWDAVIEHRLFRPLLRCPSTAGSTCLGTFLHLSNAFANFRAFCLGRPSIEPR